MNIRTGAHARMVAGVQRIAEPNRREFAVSILVRGADRKIAPIVRGPPLLRPVLRLSGLRYRRLHGVRILELDVPGVRLFGNVLGRASIRVKPDRCTKQRAGRCQAAGPRPGELTIPSRRSALCVARSRSEPRQPIVRHVRRDCDADGSSLASRICARAASVPQRSHLGSAINGKVQVRHRRVSGVASGCARHRCVPCRCRSSHRRSHWSQLRAQPLRAARRSRQLVGTRASAGR